MNAVPAEKYPDLKEAFPRYFVYFFDAEGELNSQGKMAMENLSMKKILEKAQFIFHPKQEVIEISLGSIKVTEKPQLSDLNEIAAEFMNGCGLPSVTVALKADAP